MVQEQDGAVAGRQDEDDIITGAVVRSARTGGRVITSARSGGQRVLKNKSRNKGQSSQRTAPADVQTSSKDRDRSQSNPATRQELIERIKSMPEEMLPGFVKPYADLMVNTFGIDTREKVANFFGQIAAESLRGNAEYVYYTSQASLRKAFKGRVQRQHLTDFIYRNPSASRPFGFSPKKTPWDIGGWPDVYYGGRNGNTRGKVSAATNDQKNIGPTQEISSYKINPGYYKGSPEGYAYRGHGVIQITGKVQYERMNQLFGRNGTYEKNDIDFLQNPEIASYNWKSATGVPNKFAFLSALMWWGNHSGVYINRVSLATTKSITSKVKGSDAGYQDRHKNVERYFYYLIHGVKPAKQVVQGAYSIMRAPTYTKVIRPSQLKFISSRNAVGSSTFLNSFGLKNFANLSYFKGGGSIVGPYKDASNEILTIHRDSWPVFTISKNGVAKIYKSSDVGAIWPSLSYVCAGWPYLIENGNTWNGTANKSFLRSTGRTALGIKPSGEVVVYVSSNKYIQDVINDLRLLGCKEAINFDGGGSTFLYVDGKQTLSSNRSFPNVMSWS